VSKAKAKANLIKSTDSGDFLIGESLFMNFCYFNQINSKKAEEESNHEYLAYQPYFIQQISDAKL
jgi:hypothetical protein